MTRPSNLERFFQSDGLPVEPGNEDASGRGARRRRFPGSRGRSRSSGPFSGRRQLASRGRGCPTALRFRVRDGPAQRGIAIQPYRGVANSRKLFRKTMAAAVSLGTARCRILAAKKPGLAARKKCATGLPSVRLKTIACSLCCSPAWFGRRSLNASRTFGFCGVPRGDQAARRARNLISASIDAGICVPNNDFTTPRRVSLCTAAVFRIIWRAKIRENHARRHRLAATCLKFAARLATTHGLTPACAVSPSINFGFLLLPALGDIDIVAMRLAGVELPRTADLLMRVLDHLAPLADPADGAGDRKQHGEHRGRETHRLQRDA
jgi:hypothetical protein